MPLGSADVSAAAVVLTRAFAEGPDALSYSDVSKFLTALLTVPPERAQVLVARLAPTGEFPLHTCRPAMKQLRAGLHSPAGMGASARCGAMCPAARSEQASMWAPLQTPRCSPRAGRRGWSAPPASP